MEPDNKPKEPGVNPLTGHRRKIENLRPNRKGRTPGAKNKIKTALDRTNKDPILELIIIAQMLRICTDDNRRRALESEMKIWMELLEYKQAKKKATTKEQNAPEASKAAAEATFDLLKELENEHADTGPKGTSDKTGLVNRQSSLEVKAGTEEDLQDSQGQ